MRIQSCRFGHFRKTRDKIIMKAIIIVICITLNYFQLSSSFSRISRAVWVLEKINTVHWWTISIPKHSTYQHPDKKQTYLLSFSDPTRPKWAQWVPIRQEAVFGSSLLLAFCLFCRKIQQKLLVFSILSTEPEPFSVEWVWRHHEGA